MAANNKNRLKWIRKILIWTFFLSLLFNGLSQTLLDDLGPIASLAILVLIIATGVVFDIVGVAATAAKMPPLNAQGARKVPGAKQALALARNSEKVASFCNDVIGDVCGIISGSAAAAIVFSLWAKNPNQRYIIIATMAIVASITVGGKGLGKKLAIDHSTEILMIAGKVIGFGQKLWPFPSSRDKAPEGKRGG